MDFSKIFIKDANPTKMGGQAVMEGIMMKGADRSAIAVRRADGSINIKEEPLPPKKEWMRWPVIRGVMAFVDSLVTGTRTLMYSAGIVEEDIEYEEEETEPGRLEQWIGERFGEKGVFNFLLYSSVIIALVVSVGVFVLLPTWVVGLCKAFTHNAIILNLIEGLLRIGMFIVYVALIARMNDIKRVFQYHGAEHQTIHCFENGLELTPENCAQFETLHPRCGTSFIMFVFIISLLLFSFLGWPNVVIRLLSRILLIPVVAGLSYELLRWAGRSDSTLVKVLSVPGLLMQKLTTRIPDESMLEVAIAAVNVCLSEEPPRQRVFDVDGKGNIIDREAWKRAREIADGDISPEGGQAVIDKTNRYYDNFDSADQMHDEQAWEAQRSPEAMQETIIFAELLKELERPDPTEKKQPKSSEEIDAINHVTAAAELFAEELARETAELPAQGNDEAEISEEKQAEDSLDVLVKEEAASKAEEREADALENAAGEETVLEAAAKEEDALESAVREETVLEAAAKEADTLENSVREDAVLEAAAKEADALDKENDEGSADLKEAEIADQTIAAFEEGDKADAEIAEVAEVIEASETVKTAEEMMNQDSVQMLEEDTDDVLEALAKKYAQEVAALSETSDEVVRSKRIEQEREIDGPPEWTDAPGEMAGRAVEETAAQADLQADEDMGPSFVGMVGDDDESGEKFEEEIAESFEEIFRRETIELSSEQVDEIIGSYEQNNLLKD